MDGCSRWIEHLLGHVPGGQTGFLIFVNVFVFFLAFFSRNFFEIAFIIIPLLAPVADKLGIDLVWFSVLLCVSMQTSFVHPPLDSRSFICAASLQREVSSRDIYLGALPWVGLQLILVCGRHLLAGEGVTYWIEKEIECSILRRSASSFRRRIPAATTLPALNFK